MLCGCFSATSVLFLCARSSKGTRNYWRSCTPTAASWEQFRSLELICRHVNLMLKGMQACNCHGCHWVLGT